MTVAADAMFRDDNDIVENKQQTFPCVNFSHIGYHIRYIKDRSLLHNRLPMNSLFNFNGYEYTIHLIILHSIAPFLLLN